jgi:hypothetical protein
MPTAKSSAAVRLRKFVGQLAGAARDIGVDLASKYLESKGCRNRSLKPAAWAIRLSTTHVASGR